MAQDDDDLEIHEATPEEQGFLLSTLAVRATEYGYRIRELEAENAALKRELAKGGDRVYAPDGQTWQAFAYAEAAKRGALQDENQRLREAAEDVYSPWSCGEPLDREMRALGRTLGMKLDPA